jgi:hypothetical protein
MLETFYMPWGEYLGQYKSCGKEVQEDFQYSIYADISLQLFAITIISLSFYYLYLNNRFGRYYSNKSWFITMLINCVIIALLTYLTARNILDRPVCDVSGYLLWISTINFLFAIIGFIILSFVFRLFSSMGKHTPYLTTK